MLDIVNFVLFTKGRLCVCVCVCCTLVVDNNNGKLQYSYR